MLVLGADSIISARWLHKPAHVHAKCGEPDKPTVYQNLVILTYGDRHPLAHALIQQATIHMKGIIAVLNIQKSL
jgi:hypothetical protein